MIRLLNDGTWSKPPFLTGVRQLVLRHLDTSIPRIRLGDLAEFINGTSYDKTKLVETGGAPIIRISNVSDPNAPHLRTVESFADKFMVEPGDLLVSWSASFKSLVWPGPTAVLNQHIFRVREREGVDKAYLRHAIEASLDEMLENAVGMGMKHLRRADFLGHKIPVPTLDMQSMLGTYLDALEEGEVRPVLPRKLETFEESVDALEASLSASEVVRQRVAAADADLDALRQRVLDDAVQGRLTEREPGDESAEALLVRVTAEKARRYEAGEIRKPKTLPPVAKDEQPFGVPEWWAWSRMNDLFDIRGGIQKTPKRTPRDNPYPYVGVANVQRNVIDLSETKEFELFEGDLQKWCLVEGDILIVEGNGSESEIGRCAIWEGEIAECVHQNHLIRCRPLEEESPVALSRYVATCLNSPYGIEEMKRRAVTTSGLYNLSVGKIQTVAVPIPPPAEQRRIVERVDRLLDLCDRLAERLAAARADAERLTQTVLADALMAQAAS